MYLQVRLKFPLSVLDTPYGGSRKENIFRQQLSSTEGSQLSRGPASQTTGMADEDGADVQDKHTIARYTRRQACIVCMYNKNLNALIFLCNSDPPMAAPESNVATEVCMFVFD